MQRGPRDFILTAALANLLRKDAAAHKYTLGHAVVLSGGAGRTGAARLSARGALRVGAGLVTLAVPAEAVPEVACQITAIMLRKLSDAADLRAFLMDQRINALCAGPGLGLGQREADALAVILAQGRPGVLDADALTLLGRDAALRQGLHPACVLTPHEGEFTRLFPDLAAGLAMSKGQGAEAARAQGVGEAAARLGGTVLLKGPQTLVAGPDGRCWVHRGAEDGGLAWLATAGSGDVLAGFILGLLARGIAPVLAANIAVSLHGLAARRFGPGLIAEDLPECLPAVFTDLGL